MFWDTIENPSNINVYNSDEDIRGSRGFREIPDSFEEFDDKDIFTCLELVLNTVVTYVPNCSTYSSSISFAKFVLHNTFLFFFS